MRKKNLIVMGIATVVFIVSMLYNKHEGVFVGAPAQYIKYPPWSFYVSALSCLTMGICVFVGHSIDEEK